MKTTTTVHWNKGGIAKEHNERNPKLCSHEEHIDLYNEHGQSFHETIFRQDLTEAYNEIFGEAIEEYNARQKRKDRMKTVESYMSEVEDDTRGKRQTKRVNGKRVVDEQARRGKQTEYEVTIKVGNTERERDEYGRTVYDADGHHIRPEELPRELQADILREYCETFQTSNPNFKVVSMELHADEGFYNAKGQWEYDAIHPHITFVPWCDGFKQGLSRQNSMNKALEAMGCGGADGYDKWAQKEQERLEAIVLQRYREYCLERPDFEQEHGELEIYHPVHDDLKAGDMDKEQYIREQELADKQGAIEQYAETVYKTSERVDKGINELKTGRNSLEAEKAKFEAYRASETQRIETRESAIEAREAKFETYRASEIQKIEMSKQTVLHDIEDALSKANKIIDAAKQCEESPKKREAHMVKFLKNCAMGDKSAYDVFLAREPKYEAEDREFQRQLDEFNRKYASILNNSRSRSFNDDYDMDL